MKKYYIGRRVGDGTHLNPYNSELRLYIQTNYGVRPQQQIISHTLPWVLHKYDLTEAQHSDVTANVPQVFAFPPGALDRELSTLSAVQRNAISSRLVAAGFDMSWATGTNTVRDVLQFIAHSIQLSECTEVEGPLNTPADATRFNIRTMNVGDIPADARQRIATRLQERGIDTSDVTLATPLWQVVRKIQRMDDGLTPRLMGTRIKQRWFYHDAEAE